MFRYPEGAVKYSEDYIKTIEEFASGHITEDEFKATRPMMGIYKERNGITYMMRPRIPAGVVTIKDLHFFSSLADKYAHGRIHITTRQDIQFHGLSLEGLAAVVKELHNKGFLGNGTGGNAPRAVAVPPTAGAEEEVFDVTPYAEKITEFMLKDRSYFGLPRKFKIAISNNEKNSGYAKISDMGMTATRKNGKKGFRIYGGGGLGSVSKTGVLLEKFVPAGEILYYVQGMRDLFDAEGDRKNRARARIRYILVRLGEEQFIAEFRKYVEIAKQNKEISVLNIRNIGSKITEGTVIDNIKKGIIFPENVKGRYSFYLHPVNGNIKTTEIYKLTEIIKNLGYAVTMRLTQSQGLMVRNIDGKDIGMFQEGLKEFSASNEFYSSVSCTGAATCALGILNSQGMLVDLFDKISKEAAEYLPKIRISGCPNSCGQHSAAELGFWGKNKVSGSYYAPIYVVVAGADLSGEHPKLGADYGEIPAKRMHEFLNALGYKLKEAGYTVFNEYLANKEGEFRALISEYSHIAEDNIGLYIDYGKTEPIPSPQKR